MIRRANINDLALLQQIGRKTFDDTFGNTCTLSDMQGVLERFFNTEQVQSELLDADDHFYLYEKDGKTMGYMRINAKHACPLEAFKDRQCIELVRLYVLKEYHGSSVANELMNFAIDYARKSAYEILYLSVWEYNFRARGFYEKHGFKNTGVKNDFPLGTTPQTDYWFVRELM
ncbi:MAG: GNAT family N-acetyltransferase [Bacteroidia bacterium]